MKFSTKTTAAVLMAALASGAYANTTAATPEQNKEAISTLFTLLLSTEPASNPETGEAVVDEAGNPIRAGLIPALADQIENNTKSIADTDANVDELYKAVNDHEDKFVALDARQAENRAVIEALANTTVKSFEELDNAKAEKSEIERLEQSIAVTDDNVATLFDKTNANEDKISALDARQAENRTALIALAETTVKSFEELEQSIADTDENVDELYKAVNEHEDKFVALDERQAENRTLIETLAQATLEAAEELDNRKAEKTVVDALENKLNATGAAVIEGFQSLESKKADKAAVEANGSRISTVATNVRTVNNKLTRTRDAVAALTTRVAAAEAVNETKADKVAVEAALATKADKVEVAALGNRVNELDDNLKSGLAANAALNGLFQPYNVGKVNVTAALGGYKSTTALAVGAGYRVNENFAAKAGLATSLKGKSGFTYNLGVNYEF